jgi:phosphatidylinositol-3-phosphatase
MGRARWTLAAVTAVTVAISGLTISASAAASSPTALLAAPPRPDHVVIVVLENKPYDAVVGHPRAPWVSDLAQRWASMTNFYAETHPSQPNYLALFSGSTQGVVDNGCPHDLGDRPNLGRQLLDAGHSFAGFSEDLPRVGWRGCSYRGYVRRHNPWVNFSNLPAVANQPYTAFPRDFSQLPTVSFVIPNLCHDMHDCPKPDADAWLRPQFQPYIRWATTHNSLFVLTFDEDNRTAGNHIATIVAGAGVRPAQYADRLDHYDLLRTLQDMYGLAPTGAAAQHSGLPPIWSAG